MAPLIHQDKTVAVLVTLLFSLSLTACSSTPPPEKLAYKAQLMAMGTLIDISIWGESEQEAEKAITKITQIMSDVEKTWHAWKPSALSRLNAQWAHKQPIVLNAKLRPLLIHAQQLSKQSQGYFDPAVGTLSQLWGFQQDALPTQPPSAVQISAALEIMGSIRDLEFTQTTVLSSNPYLQLDLGAIAKGYAVDLSIQSLKKQGIKHAIINAGGDLRAIGKHGKRPWRIGIRDPRPSGGGGVLASIETHGDESVFTSGDYERYFMHDGQRYHHVLNPKTGYPSKGFTSVTVIHNNATEADAMATALMVAGKQHWKSVAQAMNAKNVMLVDEQGHVILTTSMEKRVIFNKEIKYIKVSKL